MIRPPGFAAAVFGTAATGDLRRDAIARERVATELGIAAEWAYANQVHGATVLEADRPGFLGDGDAILVARPGIPVMVATADCVPVIIEADGAAAVVHAGWRGAVAGIVEATLERLEQLGHTPRRAAVGPAIGPCCYEVGPEVADQFPGFIAETSWGTISVDLPNYLASRLEGLDEVWQSGECTFTSTRLNSWRRDRNEQRQVALTWLPGN